MTEPLEIVDPGEVTEPATAGPSSRARRRLRVLAFAVVPGLFIALLVVGLLRTQAPKAVQGAVAPAFTNLPLLGGGTLSSSDLAGAPVVFNFWASWCDPCIAEAPDIERAAKKYQAQGVKVIGIDYRDTDQDAARFVQDNGITYPILRDPEGVLATKFGVTGVPETYFIDANYRFFAIGEGTSQGSALSKNITVRGAIPFRELTSQIEGLLAVKPSATPEPATP